MKVRTALLSSALLGFALLGASGCGGTDPGGRTSKSAPVQQSSPSGTVIVLIEIHAKEGQEQQAREGLVHAIRTSEKPGFLGSREYGDVNDPGAFYAVQEWKSMQDFRQHMADAAAGDLDEATSMLREPPRTAVLRSLE